MRAGTDAALLLARCVVNCTSSVSTAPTRRPVRAIEAAMPAASECHTRHAATADRRVSVTAPLLSSISVSRVERAATCFELPSPTAVSIGGRSLLYDSLPVDLLWPVRPPSPTVAPVLNVGVNRLALFRAVDADVECVLAANHIQSAVAVKGSGTRRERRPVTARERTVAQLVDEQCATAAAFHYQQQLMLDVSHTPQLAASTPVSHTADTVHSLTAASSAAHRYRLYTDSLIDVGLHHEAELRRQWVAMETQARSINRSAERAARRDMRDSVREIVNAARAGKCNEVRDRLKEATQHVDEANEARSSRAAIYTDEQLYLPLSRSRQREAAVRANMAGEKNSVGHINRRQPLFDPVPQTSEFERSLQPHVCSHSFRDDDRGHTRKEADIELPAVVEHTTRHMQRVEEQREERRREDDKLQRTRRAEDRQHRRSVRAQQVQQAAQGKQPQLTTSSEPAAPPSTADPRHTGRDVHRAHSGATLRRSSTAAGTRGSSAMRAPLWTQGQGDSMLAEVSQFTLRRDADEERRKAEERRAIAEDEKRTREQWLADEQREEREREEKEQADRERRVREQEEDEREDRERRLRFFLAQPQRGPEAADTPSSLHEAVDQFSHISPLGAAHSPERTVGVSASDGAVRRRRSIAVGARRNSVTAAGELPSLAHRRHSSLLPPASPALSSTRTSTHRSYRSSLAASAFPLSQVRSRWQNAAGKTGKEHLARRFSLVAASDSTQSQQPTLHPAPASQSHSSQQSDVAAMLPAPVDPDSSLVATNYSHDPLHSAYLQQQREQRRTATAQVYDTVKRWLEEREEEKRSVTPAVPAAASARTSSMSFDQQLVTPFSSILANQPYSPRSQQRHRTMRQQLPLSVSNPAVFAWMRRHAIVPRRTIDPSEEVKVTHCTLQPPHTAGLNVTQVDCCLTSTPHHSLAGCVSAVWAVCVAVPRNVQRAGCGRQRPAGH